MHMDLLLEAEAADDPIDRMLGLCKWFLTGWHYKTRGAIKKPLNPIIGETFACRWDNADGSHTDFCAEQVR